MENLVVLSALVACVLVIILLGVKIVPQSEAWVIERFGSYIATWQVGFHVMIPFIDRVANKVSLKESLFDYQPQPVITKDNVTMLVDSVVFYQISDPKLYTYGVDRPQTAVDKLTVTTLRNVIGELELDETLTSRETINGKLRSILDEATDPWGIKVNRVEVKNIEPPPSIKDAMEKQMKAERERRAAILDAEGKKQAVILKAEGEKMSVILQAEAKKESAIKEAEGQAQAILSVQKATADGLEMVKNVVGETGAIKLKSFETLQKVADGQSTKIIIPSDIQNLASIVTGISEVIK